MPKKIIEHTEFVENTSLRPFSATKPYHKRCAQLKLQSSGKVEYIEPKQLASQDTNVNSFPDKFQVDGFIVCVDVSHRFDEPGNPQKEFFNRNLHAILEVKKKPVVVACTKFDRAIEVSVAAVNEIVGKTKKPIPILEVSALKGVNVNSCFLVLAHLVDKKNPNIRVQSYADAKTHRDERVHHNEEMFQRILDQKLTDFSITLDTAVSKLQNSVEFQYLTEKCGTDHVQKLICAKLMYLKQEMQKAALSNYYKRLPSILKAMLSTMPLKATRESCIMALKESTQFPAYFTEKKEWKDDWLFLKEPSSYRVPFDILEEDEGKKILQRHMDKVGS